MEAEQIGRDHFSHGPPLLEGGRIWKVVTESTRWFTLNKDHIQRFWNTESMQGAAHAHGDDSNDDDDHDDNPLETSVKIAKAGVGFADVFFWAVVALVSQFSDWLEYIENWASGCACHPRKLRGHFQIRKDAEDCPMRGKRASCISSGKLHALVCCGD